MDRDNTLSERVAEEIRALLARKRVTGRELSRRLGVSSPWVSQRLTGATEIGLNDLERIARALDVEIAALLPAPSRTGGRPAANDKIDSRQYASVPSGQTPQLAGRPAGGRPPGRGDSSRPNNTIRRAVRLSGRDEDGAQ